MISKYATGVVVECISNPFNDPEFPIGKLFTIQSCTPIGMDIVYGVKPVEEGKATTVYSIDRFREVKPVPCERIRIKEVSKMGDYAKLGQEVGELVDMKNQQYGDSTNKTGEMLKLMYPNGVKPEQYHDMMLLTRMFDKANRIANGNQGDENAWQDIAGYGLLGSASIGVQNAPESTEEIPAIPVFKKGDRVQYVGSEIPERLEGIVITDDDQQWIGVEFPKFNYGHSCAGVGKNPHCWNCFPWELKHIGRDVLTDPCTKKQRGYIYGLSKTLALDPHNLPDYICEETGEPREMTEEQASETISRLLAIKNYMLEKGV